MFLSERVHAICSLWTDLKRAILLRLSMISKEKCCSCFLLFWTVFGTLRDTVSKVTTLFLRWNLGPDFKKNLSCTVIYCCTWLLLYISEFYCLLMKNILEWVIWPKFHVSAILFQPAVHVIFLLLNDILMLYINLQYYEIVSWVVWWWFHACRSLISSCIEVFDKSCLWLCVDTVQFLSLF